MIPAIDSGGVSGRKSERRIMGKNHRDNHRARLKAGDIAFLKKRERRMRRKYIGPWNVGFRCGKSIYVPIAGPDDIDGIATHMHKCDLRNCKPNKFEQLTKH
jgi:hypothetical protein